MSRHDWDRIKRRRALEAERARYAERCNCMLPDPADLKALRRIEAALAEENKVWEAQP